MLTLGEFDDATSGLDLGLWWSGETGQGRIGACAGAALRSTGEDGRFIGLEGIRDLAGTTRVADIIGRSAVAAVETADGHALGFGGSRSTRATGCGRACGADAPCSSCARKAAAGSRANAARRTR